MGSYSEQRSAIEAAALAAAKDLSALHIDDPNFGLIGLSDASPIGTATAAADGYYTEVIGINTLFGTIRLDLIIADYLEDPLMQQLALTDYNNALTAQTNLVTALNNAIVSGSTFQDINGNTLNPVSDATAAYSSNQVHLVSGQSAALVSGSLVLSLGYVPGLYTRTPVPQPSSVGTVTSNQQSQGFYLPNVDIPYTNTISNPVNNSTPTSHFIFAALGSNSTLVDFRNFQSQSTFNQNNLLYSTPTVIKVDADEQYTDNQTLGKTIHATAAALPGIVVDQRPYPGAFTISFTDPVGISSWLQNKITCLGDLVNTPQMQADPTDLLQSPSAGDYPNSTLVSSPTFTLPVLANIDPNPAFPIFENILSIGLYDWIRRGGTNVNVQSLANTFNGTINAINYNTLGTTSGGYPVPQQQRFHLTASGNVTNDVIALPATTPVNMCVSQNQFRAISGMGFTFSEWNNKTFTRDIDYDLQITDYVHQPGRKNGGMHAGEPLTVPGILGSNSTVVPYTVSTMTENTSLQYQEFGSSSQTSGVRPTYLNEGISVDFTIRTRPGSYYQLGGGGS
jgi:hypothetical protein